MARAKRAPGNIVAQNRRARYDYLIEDTLEAGLILTGSEVKALRKGQGSLAEAYCREIDGELFLVNAHIPPYAAASGLNHAPRRPRKLLLHRREIDKLLMAVNRQGVTLVPLKIFFNPRGIAKAEVAIASGKRKADKRASEKERDWKRDKARLMRDRG